MDTEKSVIKSTKQGVTVDKLDIEAAKHNERYHAIVRRSRIDGWNDYIGFVASKFLGLAGVIVGGLEALDPSYLTITLKNPELIAGLGLALLTGKGILTWVAKVEKSFGGR